MGVAKTGQLKTNLKSAVRASIGGIGRRSGASGGLRPTLTATSADGSTVEVPVVVRLDTPVEIDYYRAGGILPYVLAQILAG